MYEKPELTLVGQADLIVLGDSGLQDDSDMVTQQPAEGLVLGLDD